MEVGGREVIWVEAAGGQADPMGEGEGALAAGVRVERVGWVMVSGAAVEMMKERRSRK